MAAGVQLKKDASAVSHTDENWLSRFKLSRYIVASVPVMDEIDGRVKRVVFATRTAEVRALDESSWQKVLAGRFKTIAPLIAKELISIQVLVPYDEDELATVIESNRSAAQASDDLYLVVQPSAMCQLGCDYCGQQHTPRKIDAPDRNRLVERVQKGLATGKYRSLSVCWFGAEPLLGLPVLRELTKKFQLEAEAAGCSYGAKIVTNGLALSRRLATELVNEHSIREIEITLDGDAQGHDTRRHRKNGTATFDKIFANLVALAKNPEIDARINLRCNVDERNYERVSPLIKAIAAEGIQRRIEFYTTAVYSWGNDAHKRSLSRERYGELEIGWLIQQIELGFNPSLVPQRRPVVCMSLVPSARLYDAYGGVYNCTEVSYVPSYGVPNSYEVGKLSSAEEDTDRLGVLGDFNDRILAQDYPCASCEMLPVCGGSCPKKWLEGLVACPSAKTNMRERLLVAFADDRRLKSAQPVTCPE